MPRQALPQCTKVDLKKISSASATAQVLTGDWLAGWPLWGEIAARSR